jgi:hypothetical protein
MSLLSRLLPISLAADQTLLVGAVILVPHEHDRQDVADDDRRERKRTEDFVHCGPFCAGESCAAISVRRGVS